MVMNQPPAATLFLYPKLVYTSTVLWWYQCTKMSGRLHRMMKAMSPGRWGVIAGIPPSVGTTLRTGRGDIWVIVRAGRGVFVAENLRRGLGEKCC